MKITVVGDVLLDVDIDGETTRLCPDAPVPVVDVAAVRRRAGGAGLVASMLADDGHDVSLVTVLSDDEAGRTLNSCLGAVALVAGMSGLPTPVKTRVRAAGRSVVRYDEGCGEVRVPEVTGAMLDAIRDAAVIVVSDYGRGLTSNAELRAALETAASRVPAIWDPHPKGAVPVPGVDVVTPNLAEARGFLAEAAGLDGFAGSFASGGGLERSW
jgi:bifunctional ADP-heptose synthase (sugar kinase/adenylyltransferase)